MNVRRSGAVMLLVAATVLVAGSSALAELDASLPPRPVLPDDVAARVGDLDKQIGELRDGYLRGEIESLDDAIALAEQVLAIRLELQGPDSQAGSRWTDAQGNPAECYEVADARRAAADLRRLAALPAQDRADLASLIGSNEQAVQLERAGRYAETQAVKERQLGVRRRVLGEEHPSTLFTINDMGYVLQAQGRLAEAEPYYQEALAGLRRVLGDEHPWTFLPISNMGYLLQAQGRLAEAEPYFRDALAGWQRILGAEHHSTISSMHNMGALLMTQGRLAEAEPYCRNALSGFRRVLGEEHPSTLLSLNNMGTLLADQGRMAEAEPYYRDALAGYRRVLGDENPNTLRSLSNMGFLLARQGRLAEAEPYLRDALAGYRRVLGDEHPDTLISIGSMGYVLQGQGRLAEAEPYYRDALAGLRRVLGDEHPDTLTTGHNMGCLLLRQGRLAEAEPYYRDALAGNRRVLGDEHRETLNSISNMGFLLHAQGRLAEAEPYFRDALAGRRRVLGDDHPDTLTSVNNMGGLLEAQGKLAEAEPYYREALELAERLRTTVIGQERERIAYAEQLGMSGIANRYAAVLTGLQRGGEAFGVAERGRGRALLDLLDRSSIDLVEQARQRAGDEAGFAVALDAALAANTRARAAEAEAEAQVAALRKERDFQAKRENLTDEERAETLATFDEHIEAQLQRVATARQDSSEAGWAVLRELQGLVPDARPMPAEEIVKVLEEGELILSFAWSPEHVLLMTASRSEGTGAVVIADGEEAVKQLQEAVSALRASISQQSSAPWSDAGARAVLAAVLPDAVRGQLRQARRVVVLPDGPLNDISFELLLDGDPAMARTSVVYAASATMYLNRKRAAAGLDRTSTSTALVLGDPVFDRDAPPQPELPQSGVLVAMVQEGGNAAQGGLRRGDVLMTYAGSDVADFDALRQHIARVNDEVASGGRTAEERFAVVYWRDGEQHETTLAPGRLGIAPDQRGPALGLQAIAQAARGIDQLGAEANTLDQVRLHGGTLHRLPGTKREAEVIARSITAAGGSATQLLGEQATVGEIEQSIEGKRYVHLATHGLTGSSARPYDASLALTRPETPTPDDIGFLTLDHLIRTWRGKLTECDLVVLSACDTQRGVKQGDSVMALPWGFFYAGAPTVIASLWKVDDTATALLMGRLYENLLEGQMSKEDALGDAKRWLRGLSYDQLEELEADLPPRARGSMRTAQQLKPADASRPYEHPYFWAAFVLIGSPQ